MPKWLMALVAAAGIVVIGAIGFQTMAGQANSRHRECIAILKHYFTRPQPPGAAAEMDLTFNRPPDKEHSCWPYVSQSEFDAIFRAYTKDGVPVGS